MKIHLQKISKKLKNLREQKKLTQEELAKHLGVSRQSIIALEQGRCLPSLPLAINFSEMFKMPFEAIFTETEIIHNIHSNLGEEVKNLMSNDISPWSPMREAKDIHEAIDRLFTSNMENVTSENKMNLPAVNVYQKGKNIIVTADVPGIKEEDLSIEVGDDNLTIAGTRNQEIEIQEDEYYRKETESGTFTRVIPLPATVDKDKTEAELKDGQLIVKLPKKENILSKVTKIKVKKV